MPSLHGAMLRPAPCNWLSRVRESVVYPVVIVEPVEPRFPGPKRGREPHASSLGFRLGLFGCWQATGSMAEEFAKFKRFEYRTLPGHDGGVAMGRELHLYQQLTVYLRLLESA